MVRLKATAQFQSTLPAGEATIKGVYNAMDINISIHASRGGSDRDWNYFTIKKALISIHASRGGSDIIADVSNCA